MKRVFILTLALVALVGCASIKQAKDDYQLGKETPLAAGEISPKDQAQNIGQIISVIPGGGAVAPIAITILTGFFAFLRGRRIRKGIAPSTSPATGFLGNAAGIEGVVQTLSTVIAGAFEIGADNSPIKRAWKVGLTTLIGLGGLYVASPAFQSFITAHPDVAFGLSGLSAVLGGIEKALSNVRPVVEAPTSPAIGKVGA